MDSVKSVPKPTLEAQSMSEPVHVVTSTVVSMLSNPVVKSGCHKSAGFSTSKADCISYPKSGGLSASYIQTTPESVKLALFYCSKFFNVINAEIWNGS